MAILHKATISPTKPEVLEKLLGGPVEILGTYRFDDPDGEVGIEAFVVCHGGNTRQVVLTYRSAPLDRADEHLVSRMKHSALGPRWIYDGLGDPIALNCFRRAVLGEQKQAVLELWDGDRLVGMREPTIRISPVAGRPVDAKANLTIAIDLDTPLPDTDGPQLRAAWDGGTAIVATIG